MSLWKWRDGGTQVPYISLHFSAFSSDIAVNELFLSIIYSLFFIFLQITKNLAATIAIQWWAGLVALVA